MGLISRKLCRYLLMFLTGFTSLSVFFFLYRLPFSSLCMVFDSISCSLDEVLLINPCANVFVFGDFKACVNYFLRNFYSSPNDSLSKTMKDVFYLIQKALFVLRILKFLYFHLPLSFSLSAIA